MLLQIICLDLFHNSTGCEGLSDIYGVTWNYPVFSEGVTSIDTLTCPSHPVNYATYNIHNKRRQCHSQNHIRREKPIPHTGGHVS